MVVLELLMGVAIPLAFVVLGFSVGSYLERRHLASLTIREAATSSVLLTNLKRVPDEDSVRQAVFVEGEVVIATDYFKSIATALRNLVGGEMHAARSLLTRARREALLRMIADAQTHGATEVWNIRFASSNISQMSGNKAAMAVEIYAYGTAIVRK